MAKTAIERLIKKLEERKSRHNDNYFRTLIQFCIDDAYDCLSHEKQQLTVFQY